MKKTITALFICIMMLVPVFCLAALADNEPFTVRITDVDGVGDDENGDGMVMFYEGKKSGERIVPSEEYNLRYSYLLVFDGSGKCVQVGNNLVFASKDKSFQNYVVVPERGFLVAFYYNNDFPTNLPLFEYYTSLVNVLQGKTEDIYNRTLLIESDYTASYDSVKISLNYGTSAKVLGDCTATDPDDLVITDPGEEDVPPENIPENGAYSKITGYDEKASCINGENIIFTNNTSDTLVIKSDSADLVYKHVMVFDKDGNCVEMGYNILMSSSNPAQSTVSIPAGGFASVFFYNESEATKNADMFNLYNQAADSGAVNVTAAPTRPVKGYIEDKYLIVYLNGPAPVKDESSEDPVESSVEELSSEPVEDESSEPVESTHADDESSEPVAGDESSEQPSEADISDEGEASAPESVAPAEPEKGGANVGLIVGIAAAVAVVGAAAAFFIIKKRK